MNNKQRLNIDTIRLLDSFGKLREHVHDGDQVFVGDEHLTQLQEILERNKLTYDSEHHPGINIDMLTFKKE